MATTGQFYWPSVGSSVAAYGQFFMAAYRLMSLEQLSWRVGVHACPEVTEMLHERYLKPVLEAGTFGEHVLEAVSAYLHHRLSIPLAARSIPVHVNTLRYRLQRFSEIAGADLGDVDTLVEVSWALAARHENPTDHVS